MSLRTALTHPVTTIGTACLVSATLLIPSAVADQEGLATACPSNLVLAFPGTGETHPGANPNEQIGMLAGVTKPLTDTRSSDLVQAYYVPYPAVAIDPATATTYAQSKAEGIKNGSDKMAQVAAECPGTTFSLTGYSQGADVAGDLGSQIDQGKGPVPPDKISSVALISDPGRSATDNTVGVQNGEGHGFAGGRPPLTALSNKWLSICDPLDIYCNTPQDKPALALVGKLGSQLDMNDPVKSITSIVTAATNAGRPGGLVAAGPTQAATPTSTPGQESAPGASQTQPVPTGGNLLAQMVGSIERAAQAGNPQAAQAALDDTTNRFQQVSSSVTDPAIIPQIQEILAALGEVGKTLLRGDLIGVVTQVAALVPRVLSVGSQLVTTISQIVAKLPVAEFGALAATTAAIVGFAQSGNFAAIPPLIGTWVGQLNNVASKTAESGVLQMVPGLANTVLGQDPSSVVGQAVDFAEFLAGGSHTSYGTKAIVDGRTGTQAASNFIAANLSGGAAQDTAQAS